MSNKKFDSNTSPILHVYGKHIKLGFENHFNLMQHHYSLQHDVSFNQSANSKIFFPICGVAQQLQFCFTNITDKPSFNNTENEDEDFGVIEIYGYSLMQIPAPRTSIFMLNLSSFFQFRCRDFIKNDHLSQEDFVLLMTAAECDTMCAFISIQSRYFNQAKELLARSKKSWLKLYDDIRANEDDDERNTFLRQMREKCDRFKYNALRLEILIAYIMNRHNDFEAQIQSILNIVCMISEDEQCNGSKLLPMQMINKHSSTLIKTMLMTTKDKNEFVQLASLKNICFMIEKLGCNIKEDLCHILSQICDFDSVETSKGGGFNSKNLERVILVSKPLHIQSIIRQIMVVKHNICDFILNLIADCSFQTVELIFEQVIIANFGRIIKLEPTKLAYCLRIVEICIDRLHSTPSITPSILTSMIGLMFHSSKRVRNIATSIWSSLLSLMPTQILSSRDNQQQIGTCQWLIDMISNTALNRIVSFPSHLIPTIAINAAGNAQKNQDEFEEFEANHDDDEEENEIFVLQIPLNIINKVCEMQISRNSQNGLFTIIKNVKLLGQTLKNRMLNILKNSNDLHSHFESFRLMLQTLEYLCCAIKDYHIFDELAMNVLSRFLSYLKTSSPSLIMLKVCVEFMEYVNLGRNDADNKYLNISLQILREFIQWIPHSIHDETFLLVSKLVDMNFTHLLHSDFCSIVQSLLSKYTLRSATSQKFQQKLISKIYQRIDEKKDNDDDLFQLITKITIFDAANFENLDKMSRYFEFAFDWMQHSKFESVYIADFNLIFMRIITIFNTMLFECKNQQIVQISIDIVTSLSLHFSSAIDKYCETESNLTKICNILSKLAHFYLNALNIDIGDIQFHSLQNITLFLHSIILCSNKLTKKQTLYGDIQKLLERLLKIPLDAQFTNISDLSLWTVCKFYYEIARYNATNCSKEQNDQSMDIVSDNNSISLNLDDTDLILRYAQKMAEHRDYKIRRWCGLLIFLRFYLNNPCSSNSNSTMFDSDSTVTNNNANYEEIYQDLLYDFDEYVSKPLMTLIQIDNTEDTIQFIENSNLLSRPDHLLTTNSENEVLIDGKSDTASINQARSKNMCMSDNNKFPALFSDMAENELKIDNVDEHDEVIEVIDLEDVFDDANVMDVDVEVDVDDDKENNKLLSNQQEQEQQSNELVSPSDSSNSSETEESLNMSSSKEDDANDGDIDIGDNEEEDDEEDEDSPSSEENISSSSPSISPRSTSSDDNFEILPPEHPKVARKKVEIPLLPLHQINNFNIQTNIKCDSSNVRTRDSLSTYYNKESEEVSLKKQIEPAAEESVSNKMHMDTSNMDEIVTGQEDDDSDQREDDAYDDGADERIESIPKIDSVTNNEEVLNAEHINANNIIEKNEEEKQQEQQVEEPTEERREEFKHFNEWVPPQENDYITFRRGDNDRDDDNGDRDDNLMYIDSFLQSISVSNDGIDANDISVSIKNECDDINRLMDDCNSRRGFVNDNDDELDAQLEEFRKRELSDYLVPEKKRRRGDRKKDWWMKYL